MKHVWQDSVALNSIKLTKVNIHIIYLQGFILSPLSMVVEIISKIKKKKIEKFAYLPPNCNLGLHFTRMVLVATIMERSIC